MFDLIATWCAAGSVLVEAPAHPIVVNFWASVFWRSITKPCGEDGCWFSDWGKAGLFSRYSYRSALWLTTGQNPHHLFACHHCDNGHLRCCNPAHLYWGSAIDNARDKAIRGRNSRWPTLAATADAVRRYTASRYVVKRGAMYLGRRDRWEASQRVAVRFMRRSMAEAAASRAGGKVVRLRKRCGVRLPPRSRLDLIWVGL